MSQNDLDPRTIGRKIRIIREAEGLNQSQFAAKVGLTQSAISQFEDGKRMPSTKAIQKIAAACGRTIDSFMNENALDRDYDTEKDAAIQALVSKLKQSNINKEAIINLNRFIDSSFSDRD